MGKKSKNQFEHVSTENVDAAFNYLAMVSEGLKKRRISLMNEDGETDFKIPDQAEFKIEAKRGKRKNKLSFTLSWKEKKEDS